MGMEKRQDLISGFHSFEANRFESESCSLSRHKNKYIYTKR